MLVFLQFPFADLRPFYADGRNRLTYPDWPIKAGLGSHKPFVRSFGSAEVRRRGADYAFLDEQTYCGAANAIKFKKRSVHSHDFSHQDLCAFRRLFFDGVAVARVEIGMAVRGISESVRFRDWDFDVEYGETYDQWSSRKVDPINVLFRVIGEETTVVNTRKRATDSDYVPLVLQGPALARLFAHSTSKRPLHETVSYRDVVPCNPLVIVECTESELNPPPEGFTKVAPERVGGVTMMHGKVNAYGGVLDVWLVAYGSVRFEVLRSVRLCLARLHAEREVLQSVLSRLKSGALFYEANRPHGDLLEQYLNRSTKTVSKEKWSGVEQSAILDVMMAAEEASDAMRSSYLAQALDGARKQIVRKAERFERIASRSSENYFYVENIEHMEIVRRKQVTSKTINIGNNATVNAPVVIADSIENSFNKIAASDVDNEVRSLMERLLKEITDMGGQVSEDEAKDLARDAETLSEEVTKEAPSRRWYEFSIEGIKKAATAAGEIGVPVLKTVGKLLPLLVKLFP